MKNKTFTAIVLTLSCTGTLYGVFSLWVGLDPLPVAGGIAAVSLFVFWYALLWTIEEAFKNPPTE